jgi:hypothetical protein
MTIPLTKTTDGWRIRSETMTISDLSSGDCNIESKDERMTIPLTKTTDG